MSVSAKMKLEQNENKKFEKMKQNNERNFFTQFTRIPMSIKTIIYQAPINSTLSQNENLVALYFSVRFKRPNA